MAIPWRKATLFGGALVAGVAAGAIGMMSLRGGDGPYASSPAPADQEILAAAQALLEQVKKHGGVTQTVQQRVTGDRNIFSGTGDIHIGGKPP